MVLSFPDSAQKKAPPTAEPSGRRGARSSRARASAFELTVTIKIARTANPALYWVQWKSNANASVRGRVATGIQTVNIILQALRYLGRQSW